MSMPASDTLLTDVETTTRRRRIRVPREGPLNPEQAIEALRREVSTRAAEVSAAVAKQRAVAEGTRLAIKQKDVDKEK